MPELPDPPPSNSLRRLILNRCGQDVGRCQGCQICNSSLDANADIPLDSLIQLILVNDVEVLTCRTFWSDVVLANAQKACICELNIKAVLLALRTEAIQRGLKSPFSERPGRSE
jgi:heterodisulfide reductase subunit C